MDPRPTPLTLALILIAFSGIMSRAGEEQTKTQCTATGCSAAAPPASELSATKISECLARIANQPIGEPSLELETLLFHSKGVVPHLQGAGQGPLTAEQAKFLKHELARTHAKVELRIVDAYGEVLMTFDRSVPIGEKQHLHPEESRGFTPPEISFTIHRVGLNHLWTRL